jgi:hypothetical protein
MGSQRRFRSPRIQREGKTGVVWPAINVHSIPPAVPEVRVADVGDSPDGSNVIDENAANSALRSSSLASGDNPTRVSNARPAAIHRARRNSQPG